MHAEGNSDIIEKRVLSMKVPAINFNNPNGYRLKTSTDKSSVGSAVSDNYSQIKDLQGMPYIYPVSFTSIQNSSKLRVLFSYGLPCMYSGIEMIDPKLLTRWMKNKLFSRPASQVLEILEPHRKSIIGIESKVLDIVKDRSLIYPEKNIKEILQEVEPIYRRRLRKKQAPIFHDLTEAAYDLPESHKYRFKLLMAETDKKLNEKPIMIPFSSYEFKYKLSKIKDDILNGQDLKSKKVMNKLVKESKRFSNTTNKRTIENQQNVLGFLEHIWRKSVLRNNVQLKELFETSRSRLSREEIIVPFSRKSFIYDLARLLEDIPNKKLQEKMLTIAQQLPTSQESTSAYILKVASEPVDKIGHRLIWPSLASVEHILPRSEGGLDMMANFGGATTRANSNRKSMDFVTHLKLHPEAKLNCQKYLDRVIELYHKGIFARHNISPRYITDFHKTIYNQSKHTLNLDLSRLNK